MSLIKNNIRYTVLRKVGSIVPYARLHNCLTFQITDNLLIFFIKVV